MAKMAFYDWDGRKIGDDFDSDDGRPHIAPAGTFMVGTVVDDATVHFEPAWPGMHALAASRFDVEVEPLAGENARLRALVSWIEGACVDELPYLEIRGAIERWKDETYGDAV